MPSWIILLSRRLVLSRTRSIITVLITTTLVCCRDQRQSIEKLVFDNSQIATKEVHNYKFYDDGKIKVDRSVIYIYKAGIQLDSIVSKKIYKYEIEGRVEKITDITDSTMQMKVFDEYDSLVAELTINNLGDTTFLSKSDYKQGRRITSMYRILNTKVPENLGELEEVGLRSYDTIFQRVEFTYSGDHLDKTFVRDMHGNITEEIHHFYEDGVPTREITYSFLGGAKFVSETKIYMDNDSRYQDYVIIGVRGDTTAIQRTFLQEEMEIVISYRPKMKMQNIMYYNLQGQLIGTADIDLIGKTKDVYSFSYDDKGNVLEQTKYREMISTTN